MDRDASSTDGTHCAAETATPKARASTAETAIRRTGTSPARRASTRRVAAAAITALPGEPQSTGAATTAPQDRILGADGETRARSAAHIAQPAHTRGSGETV